MDTTTATRENQQQSSATSSSSAAAAAALTSLTNEDSNNVTKSMKAKDLQSKTIVSPSRLGTCEVCAAKPASYCCPKCEVKTCCVLCSQIHKHELNCDGIRDRTRFIPLDCMSKQDFMSDYYFLEECARYTQLRKYDRVKSYTRRCRNEFPVHVQRLLRAAYRRRIRLVKSLPNFSRYKQNTTVFNWKHHKIYWRVEWIFINAIKTTKTPNDVNVNNDDVASASFVRYVDERCDEKQTLHTLLDKYINNELEYKELTYYQSAGMSALKLFLRAEHRLPNGSNHGKQYFQLDIAKSLNANLVHKTIIEYPSIYVSYEQQPAGFELVVDDDDVDNFLDFKTKFKINIDRLLKKRETESETETETESKAKSIKIATMKIHENKDENKDAATSAAFADKTITTQSSELRNFLFYESDEDNNVKKTT